MAKEEPESISREDYDALFGKLAKVEEMLEKQATPEVTKEDFDKMSADVAELRDQIKEIGPEVQKMADAEKPDLVEKSTVDEMAKTIETIQKQVETLENMPLMKGIQDVGDGKPKKLDVMKGVFHSAFPEAGGK